MRHRDPAGQLTSVQAIRVRRAERAPTQTPSTEAHRDGCEPQHVPNRGVLRPAVNNVDLVAAHADAAPCGGELGEWMHDPAVVLHTCVRSPP